MISQPQFVPFGVGGGSFRHFVSAMVKKHPKYTQGQVETAAEKVFRQQYPVQARLLLTWVYRGLVCTRDCVGLFPDSKEAFHPEFLNKVEADCRDWTLRHDGVLSEIWVSVNGPVLCWRNAEVGWTRLR